MSARQSPANFINSLPKDRLNIIDEVQRVPDIYFSLKNEIDNRRLKSNGKSIYLLTGSAHIFTLPNLADALVGRTAILSLYPFSSAEIMKSECNFIKTLFNEEFVIKKHESVNLIDIIRK